LSRSSHQRLTLSGAGRDYYGVVRDALDRIAGGTEWLLQRQAAGVLTISTSPDFAAKWLVHRLGRFAEAHADIDLRISATAHQVDFAREEVDLAVRHGDGRWPGLHVERLCVEQLFPVCSPKLATGRQRLRKPADVLKFKLLHLENSTEWSRWLAAAEVADAGQARGPVLNRASMLIDAAVDSQGIALARTSLAAWDLLSGRLIRPFVESLRLSSSYWIVCPKATAMLAKVKSARTWLLAEAADDLHRLKQLQTAAPMRRGQ
jgi:LysR family transcriptional regulator, glycine cleavage system transcriptional activator